MFTKKHFDFVNTNKPYCKKAEPCEKPFSSFVARFKNVLITKLLTNVNFLIFHKKVVLVKLSIGKTIKLQVSTIFGQNTF